MARPHHTPIFPTDNDDHAETAAVSGCGCFRRFCLGRGEDESSYLLRDWEGSTWLGVKLAKLRELSEMVAGPKWKNLIRKLGRVFNPKKRHDYTAAPQFDQYSPESYALNFAGDDRQDDGDFCHSFSTRFAPGYFINDQQRKPVV